MSQFFPIDLPLASSIPPAPGTCPQHPAPHLCRELDYSHTKRALVSPIMESHSMNPKDSLLQFDKHIALELH